MKRRNTKTPRDFSKSEGVTCAPPTKKETLPEFDGFKLGDTVYYNTSLTAVKYSTGILREIVVQMSGSIAFSIWDTERQMWRTFLHERVFKEKPHVPRKRLN